jgi:hypothetical protein
VTYAFTGGDRGWRGDVPIVRLNIAKMRSLGWAPTRTSAQALREAMQSMLADLRAGTGCDGEHTASGMSDLANAPASSIECASV